MYFSAYVMLKYNEWCVHFWSALQLRLDACLQIFYDLVRQINRKNPDALGRNKKDKKRGCIILWWGFVLTFCILLSIGDRYIIFSIW